MPQLNEANKALLDHLNKLDPKVQLEVANAIWLDQKSVDQTLISLRSIKERLSGGSGQWKFSGCGDDQEDQRLVQRTHAWENPIHRRAAPQSDPSLDAAGRDLLPAASGLKSFSHQSNEQPAFHFGASGQEHSASAHMRVSGHYSYLETDGFQAVELPYVGGSVSMFVFLPRKGLDDFLKRFAAADFESSVKQMRFRQGDVELPRFKLENEYDLTRVLPRMGMADAFTAKADFRAMSDEPLFVGFVQTKDLCGCERAGNGGRGGHGHRGARPGRAPGGGAVSICGGPGHFSLAIRGTRIRADFVHWEQYLTSGGKRPAKEHPPGPFDCQRACDGNLNWARHSRLSISNVGKHYGLEC